MCAHLLQWIDLHDAVEEINFECKLFFTSPGILPNFNVSCFGFVGMLYVLKTKLKEMYHRNTENRFHSIPCTTRRMEKIKKNALLSFFPEFA